MLKERSTVINCYVSTWKNTIDRPDPQVIAGSYVKIWLNEDELFEMFHNR